MLVGYEMEWTVRYFQNRCEFWAAGYLDDATTLGSRAHSYRQHAFWETLVHMADNVFGTINTVNYKSPVTIT